MILFTFLGYYYKIIYRVIPILFFFLLLYFVLLLNQITLSFYMYVCLYGRGPYLSICMYVRVYGRVPYLHF